ncbi:hypothetical protein BDZ85DRAFT_194722 [Elsinoe ampelina]|uniref:Uncharacterized protein n=1 Tax=Elsinoe ampelina TaxID=302913 RepID=A0A6A6GIE8_9PEZI|nr:hypothetical protein BDZ85DRAFT_194722 [Elsinoe ampelina]
MPYGRGGAGNFEAAQAVKQAAQDRAANDVEAQKGVDDDLTKSLAESKAPAQYAHSGRGGAGNYYSPQELTKTGQFEATAPGAEQPDIPTTSTLQSKAQAQATLPAYRGRGGAGNYETTAADAKEISRTQAEHAEKEQERIRESIAKDVESGLARPERARLPGNQP